MAFEFMWFEGGNYQTQLEESMELTFGFPAIAAYSMDKGVYAVHRASFTEQNIRKFLTGITTGKSPTYKVRDMPKVVTVDPWDGKDGVPFEEEPFEWDDDDDVESDGNGNGDEL
jgi:protein disulfide-isomerase A6